MTAYQEYELLLEEGKSYRDDNFCSVIAFASLLDVSYLQAYELLRKQGRKKGVGVNVMMMSRALKSLGAEVKFVELERKKSHSNMAQKYSTRTKFAGKKILSSTGGHITHFKNGGYVDYRKSARKMVDFYIEVELPNNDFKNELKSANMVKSERVLANKRPATKKQDPSGFNFRP